MRSEMELRLSKNAPTAVTDANEIRAAYDELAQQLRNRAQRFSRTVGWPSGHRKVIVFWHERHRFWVALSPTMDPNHYWLGFGLQDPARHKAMNITCEVNPPRKGVDRRCAGVLLRDSAGGILLGHSGKVGGGQKGVGKKAFLEKYRGKTQRIAWTDGKKTTTGEVVVFGRIGAPNFLNSLGRFIVDVDSFKQGIKGLPNTSALLTKAEKTAKSEAEFNPENLLDSRRKVIASIVSRRGQPAFRKALLSEYGGRCAVTGCNCPEALEAAHIRPYLGEETNHITNGLLLRSDLHTLFDLQKVSVSGDYTLLVSKELMSTVYGKLHGKSLRLPRNPDRRPNLKVLAEHRAGMKGATDKK